MAAPLREEEPPADSTELSGGREPCQKTDMRLPYEPNGLANAVGSGW